MNDIEKYVSASDSRPGYSVVNYREIALPVFRIHTLVTLQAQSKIGPIEEFVFRALKNQIVRPKDISYFLGLPEIIVNKQLGLMVYESTVKLVSKSTNKFSLTKKGEIRLRELSKTSICKEVIPFYIDGITRDVVPVTSVSLYKNKELDAMGIAAVPPIPRRSPKGNELDVRQLNRVLDVMSGTRHIDKKVIKVDALVDKSHLYFRPAIAVGFKSESGRSVSIGFIIDGILSQAHEDSFMEGDHARKSVIFGDIFNVRKRRLEIQKISKELENDVSPSVCNQDKSSFEPGAREKLTLKGPSHSRLSLTKSAMVKTLSVYEHPSILNQAIAGATERLLIISPWIRKNVVNDKFIKNIEECILRNVQVTIAYGLGRDDKGAYDRDVKSLNKLKELSKKYNNFNLMRKGNTHAKVLLKDSDFFVTTSFNWLSFRGDPNQPFREEEGMYISDKNIVDDYYERLIARLTMK